MGGKAVCRMKDGRTFFTDNGNMILDLSLIHIYELGESGPSIHSEARTTTLTPAQMPGYKLLNESDGKGQLSTHILSVTHGRGSMVGSSLDEGSKNSALGVADKDYGSYYQVLDWDDGASYPLSLIHI